MNPKFKALIIGLAFAIPSIQSQAATATSVMAVSATVLTACVVVATPLTFGSYDTTAGAVDASATVNVTCTGGANYTIALDTGAGTGATFASRKMTSGLNLLNYSVYSDTTHATVWGDGTLGSSVASGTGSLGTVSHTAYGRIAGSQAVNAGVYADVVTVTLNY